MFLLECECGSQSFNVYKDAKKEYLEVVCNECGAVVATIPMYAVDWKEEDEDVSKDSD